MKIKYWIIIIFVILMYSRLSHSEKIKKPVDDRQTVEVATVAKSIRQDSINVTGTTRAIQSVDLSPSVAGKIEKILFESDQKVKKDDVLVVLNHDEISASIEMSQKKLDYLKKNYSRYLILHKKGIIPIDTIEKLKSEWQQESANLKRLMIEKNERYIKAPFDGCVGIKNITIGQYIQTGQKVIDVQNTQKIILDIHLPENLIQGIHISDDVEFYLPHSSKKFFGKIMAHDSHVDLKSHTINYQVIVNNSDNDILPGMFVSARILSGKKRDVFLIPQASINFDMADTFVYVVRQGQAFRQSIKILTRENDNATIEQGLHEHDFLVVAGQNKLTDGTKIKILGKANALHQSIH